MTPVHFAFTDQQLGFRDAVRAVLAKECTSDDVRAAFADPALGERRWRALSELGAVGLTVPEQYGGLGLSLVDLVLLLEEAGRVALPEPLLETAALGAPLLAELDAAGVGATDVASEWLTRIAAGEAVVTVTTRPSGAGTAGTSTLAGAVGADLFVLVVRDDRGDVAVQLVPAASATVEPVPTLDPTRRIGIVRVDEGGASTSFGGPAATGVLARTNDRGAIASAAFLLGLSDRMITMAADYAKVRAQFGKPIGSFQAVKHRLADARVLLEFARPTVYAAAWAYDEGEPTASRAASTAKACASDAGLAAAGAALQVHGAIGYTWECDLHLFLKRTWALAETWGSAADHRAAVLGALLAER